MANKRQIDYDLVLGDVIQDDIQRRLILEGLQNFQQQQSLPKSKQPSQPSKINQSTGANRANIQQLLKGQQLNFQEQLDNEGKKFKKYKLHEPQRFKILGFNQSGRPLFKISDLYTLPSQPKIKEIFDKYYNQIIYGANKNALIQTGQLSKKNEKGYDFQKLIQNWQKKQYQDFTNDKKNKMNQKQLEEIVVNRGDSKNNYWVYKIGERKKYDYQDIFQRKYNKVGNQNQDKEEKQFYNYNLLNPNFIQNMHRAADRIRLQYAKIQQFQSDQQEKTGNTNNIQQQKNNNTQNQKQNDSLYWGQLKNQQNKAQVNKPFKTVLLEQQIQHISTNQPKKDSSGKIIAQIQQQKNNIETFVDQIIKEYSSVNYQIVNSRYKGKQTLNQYNRIQFHLQNPHFFLTKLHYALQKKSQLLSNFAKGSAGNKNAEIGLNRNLSAASVVPGGDRSLVSGSRTGNQQTIRASQMDQNYQFNQDDDHETLQSKIYRQMSLQSKKPINHSEVAAKLYYIKFSNELQYFKNYHRNYFRYDLAFENKTRISLLRNLKPLKCKGTDFNINVQKKDSYTKFSKPQSFSLASGDIKEYIMIQYIQQNPLLMSDAGMCERMILQINNKQMLQKINRDIIEENQIEDYEDMRDNPNNKSNQNKTTQHKMELWRKNIKNHFGENGKVYLWEPKRQSKLIGNPEGFGVALMQSNLAAVPIVKKTPNKRDFLLVREKDRWVLRKIDSLYVSGQVQPKQEVFSPGDRPYQTFLEKYQIDFLTKRALSSPNMRISIDAVKGFFPNTPQTSTQSRIRKILKQKMNSDTRDNKTYHIKLPQNEQIKFKLQPQEFCLFQRMQKSICQLEEAGIHNMKNMEKMKSILRKYFQKTKNKDLQHFSTARMIRDQLQLTSWYLTESFRKFIDKNARIQMVGHADPTNGHGGYSFVKKPQKQRTDKDEAQQKPEKNKLSGTKFDLRKLRQQDSTAILQKVGYSREQLQKLGRWDLVHLLKSQKDTEYARKQRQNKQIKQQNQRKQRSKALNTLLKNLRNQQQGLIQPYQYNYNSYLDLNYYCQRQISNWQVVKDKFQKRGDQNDENDDDGQDDD